MKFSIRGIVALAGCALFATPALATEQGWSLYQSAHGGAALSGGMTLYITPNGMRTNEPKSGINLMTHGPSWTVYIFNDKTKRMYSTALQPWLASFKKRNLVGRFEGATWKRGTQNTAIAGIRAYQFIMDKPPVIKTTSKALNGKMAHYNTMTGASLWVASDIQTPPEVSNILAQIYGVPDCQRIPLRVVVNETGKPPSTAVDTMRVAQIGVPDSMFAVPRGYVATQSDSDVFIDKESADTLDEMLQDLDQPTRRPAQRPGQPAQRPGQPYRR